MWKRLLSALAAVLVILSLVCPTFTASAEETLLEGDTVRYIFSIGQCENAAGIAVDSYYNTELLQLEGEPEFLVDGQGLVNSTDGGVIKWNIMISGGSEFSGEDVLVETFTVSKKCTIEDIDLSFDCKEIFSHSLVSLPVELVSARIETIATGTERDETDTVSSDEETPIKEDTSSKADTSSSETPSSARIYPPVEITTTDLTTSEDAETLDPDSDQPTIAVPNKTTSSRIRVSASVSSKTESVTKSAASSKTVSGTSKNETTTTPDKNDNSSSESVASTAVSSKTASVGSGAKATPETPTSKAASSAAASLTARSTSTVQTAGRIFIASIAAVLAAAGAVVFLAKKIKTE